MNAVRPRRLPLAAAGLSALLLLVLSSAAAAGSPRLSGPLRVDNAYPPILPFLFLPAESPAGLETGRFAFSGAATYGNVFHWDPEALYTDLEVRIDGEVLKLALGLEYGLLPGLHRRGQPGPGGPVRGDLRSRSSRASTPCSASRTPTGRSTRRTATSSGWSATGRPWSTWRSRSPPSPTSSSRPSGPCSGGREAAPGWPCRPPCRRRRAARAASPPTGPSTPPSACWPRTAGRRFAAWSGLRWLYFGAPAGEPLLGFRANNLSFFLGLEWAPSQRVSWLAQVEGTTLPYTHPHRWFGTISGATTLGARFRLGDRLSPAGALQRGVHQLRLHGHRGGSGRPLRPVAAGGPGPGAAAVFR